MSIIKCWTIKVDKAIIDRIPDDGSVDSASELMEYMRSSGNIKVKYVNCTLCGKCESLIS